MLAAALAAACAPGRAATSPTPSPSAPVAPASGGGWPQYHGDAARSGVLPGGHGFASARVDWRRASLDGDVYASPILAAGLVIVATENDSVYAFSAQTGTPRWQAHLGRAVTASTLPCGDIEPVSGITGTPAADPAAGLLYVVGFLAPGRHVLFTLDLATGAVRRRLPADPPRDSPLVLQQRGALALSAGRVYVAYGGLFGDCGAYHGWIGAAPASAGPGATTWFEVPACARECGLWAPGGPTVDPGGDLLVATGNGSSTTAFDYGDSVLRLSPDLRLLDWYAPSDWAALNASDRDLGSISPALLPGGLVWISGKGGTGYLLRAGRLGHIGGQAFAAPACRSYASTAVLGGEIFLACGEGYLLQIRVSPAEPSFSPGWRARLDAPGGPIAAYGALWAVATADGSLAAFDPASGRRLFTARGDAGRADHFASPAAGGGRVYAALGGELLAVAVSS